MLIQKAKQQINFSGSLDVNATMFFITEEVEKKHFGFFLRNYENIMSLFCLNIISI